MMKVPTPSPTKGNSEKLYLFGPVARVVGAAYDAMPRRRARDADPDEEQHPEGRPDPGGGGEGGVTIEAIRSFIEANMDPRAFAKVEQMLDTLAEQGSGEEGAEDDPPPFRGMPRPGGGKFEQDGEPDLLPRAAGYRTVPSENERELRGGGSPGKDGSRRRFAHDGASLASFEEEFGVGYTVPSADASYNDQWRNRQLRRR